MTPSLILFSINSIMRLVQTGRAALSDYAADRPAVFPMVKVAEISSDTIVDSFFHREDVLECLNTEEFEESRKSYFVEDSGSLFVRDDITESEREGLAALRLFLLESKLEGIARSFDGELSEEASSENLAGVYLVNQWGDKASERGPLARILFAVGSIAAEYVQINPAMFGTASGGGRFLVGFSGSISELLIQYIDQSTFNGKAEYAEHALGLILRASLSTLQENPNLIASEKHVEVLVSNTLKPVLEAIPENFSANDRLDFIALSEAFTGPALNAALNVLSENSDEFLGNRFEKSEAAGMLAGALLSKAADEGLARSMTSEGLFELYKAALSVISDSPEIFVKYKEVGDWQSQATRDLFDSVLKSLQDIPRPFDLYFKKIPVAVFSASLEAVGRNTSTRFSHGEWEKVASEIGGYLLTGLAQELREVGEDGKGAISLFGEEQLAEMSKIVLKNIAVTPSMTGVRKAEVQQVIAALARAMIAEKGQLLTRENWRKIAGVAAQEAAKNPGRLFSLNEDDKQQNFAADLMEIVLGGASKALSTQEGKDHGVLFGDTLEQAITLTLRTFSGSPEIASDNKGTISEIVENLVQFTDTYPGLYGSNEWLSIFDRLLGRLSTGKDNMVLASPDDARVILSS